MQAAVILASLAVALCVAIGISFFIHSWQEARLVKDYRIPLIDIPVGLTKKGFMEFKFSRKYEVLYFATDFLDCDKAFPIDKISISGAAKILDKDGKILSAVDLKEDCCAVGFPAIALNSKMFYPLLNLPDDMGDYTLQIFLDEGVSGLQKEKIYIKALPFGALPLFFNAGAGAYAPAAGRWERAAPVPSSAKPKSLPSLSLKLPPPYALFDAPAACYVLHEFAFLPQHAPAQASSFIFLQ